ncbi:MAG: hypothetical protein AVDCRST_MAG04-956, partial [uncultured Acetobacteraceae bacterium]
AGLVVEPSDADDVVANVAQPRGIVGCGIGGVGNRDGPPRVRGGEGDRAVGPEGDRVRV